MLATFALISSVWALAPEPDRGTEVVALASQNSISYPGIVDLIFGGLLLILSAVILVALVSKTDNRKIQVVFLCILAVILIILPDRGLLIGFWWPVAVASSLYLSCEKIQLHNLWKDIVLSSVFSLFVLYVFSDMILSAILPILTLWIPKGASTIILLANNPYFYSKIIQITLSGIGFILTICLTVLGFQVLKYCRTRWNLLS